MVKKKSKIEDQFFSIDNDLDEEFITANDQIANDIQNELDEDEDFLADSEQKDSLLLDKLRSLDGKKSKRLRTELVKGELDVILNSTKKIRPSDLLNSLSGIHDSGELKKIFSKAQSRTKVLDTPLPAYLSGKAQRLAAYSEEKKQIAKWDPVVRRNRAADQLVFPLKQPDYSLQTASAYTKAWKPETDMERQISEILETSENNLTDQKLLTQAELRAIQAMSLEEMKQKRSEFLKLKAMQMYQESKFKRLKNIKSKRYRKILKKQRQKEEQKQMDALESNDPVKFRQVVEQMEKDRMKERMSLKHKNTSKWAKKQAAFAKYNDQARDQVQQQLEIGKNLRKKLPQLEVKESDEEEAENEVEIETKVLENNPWMKMMEGVGGKKADEEKKEIASEFAQPKAFKQKEEIVVSENESESELEEEVNGEGLAEVTDVLRQSDGDEQAPQVVNIQPLIEDIKFEAKSRDKLSLSEAFADDDVVEEFRAQKKSVIESEKVKAIDLRMPGWGDWSGAGIDPNEHKKRQKNKARRLRKKLVIRPQDVLAREELERRDKGLEHVIISEKKDTRIAEFQISDLPRRFDNVHDFEAKIAQPIGRTWNPDFKFRKLIQPKIKTKLGSVIQPIDKDDVVKDIKKK
ncbi:U3 small nucleolar RNA-associated 14 -like protein [Brachionus plicatilis]|uniref:U3 small nucleolar RNA-associated 14-like protein n=1 Tax=Brachionus plicatilis TaxID=10195 RepID=A0A3M7PFL8_BRAPC|nr:U3 small nucleolar RNA-associated 14 -like protein [Brachionus plicatilis]